MNTQTLLRSLITALWLLSGYVAHGQIVNIERQRIVADSTGWLGQAGIAFAGARNTKSFINIAANTLVEYKSHNTKDLWLLITNLTFLTAEGEDFSNAGFGHLRYNRKLSDAIRWEMFAQIQYNALTKIDQRIIGGLGPRFKLTQYEQAKFYFGIAYMYEYEVDLDPAVTLRDHRLSSYFSFSLSPEEDVSFVTTIYAQPLLERWGDYRITSESMLTLGITDKLQLTATFIYAYDAVPPVGVPTSIYSFSNGLEVKF